MREHGSRTHRAGPGAITRRDALAGLGSLGGLALLAACTGRRATTSATTPATAGGTAATGTPYAPPTSLAAANGVLAVTLVAAAGLIASDDGERWATTYNGTAPGPTLRVRPGDRLRIRLENRLAEPTNLHTHGLHVSPSGTGDDPFVMVAPGEAHDYEYAIPADHPSGTFWYHPHHHGRVAPQVAGGMAGAIVVEELDPPALLRDALERVLVLSDPRIGRTAAVLDASPMERMNGRVGDGVLVNGQRRPTVAASAGTLERWRFVNASASRTYRLRLDGLAWHLAGTDGGLLAGPVAAGEVALAPGERVELLVPAGGPGAVLTAASDVATSGGMGMRGRSGTTAGSGREVVLRVVVAGDATAPAVTGGLGTVRSLASVPIERSRRLTLAMGMGGGMGTGASFTIDGRGFDATRTDIRAALGTVEEWVVANTSAVAHPFHLHVWPFQVLERSDAVASPTAWKDVVDVPAGGWVRLRVAFADFTGRAVYHCHILDHEDLGMMGVIEVA